MSLIGTLPEDEFSIRFLVPVLSWVEWNNRLSMNKKFIEALMKTLIVFLGIH